MTAGAIRTVLDAGAPPTRDRVVALACAVGLAAVAVLLWLDMRGAGAATATAEEAGRLRHAEGGVLRRPAGTLVWERTSAGASLSARDSVYVPPGGSASVELGAGTSIELEESSLVVIEPPDPAERGARLALLRGELSGTAGQAPLAVRSGRSLAVLEPAAQARLTAAGVGSRVDVLSGTARVDGAAVAALAGVRLEAPARGQRFYARRFPTSVALRWDGAASAGLTLEVGRDAGFSGRRARAPGEAGRFDLDVREAGGYHWRLVDAGGRPRSEARKLVVVADRPPTPFSPASGEIVLAPRGVPVPFWWTAAEGAARYQMEIAAEPSFRNPAFAAPASGPGLWAPLELPEGIYYWRVRVADPGRGEAPHSAAVPFRLIRLPLPDAPRLLDPTIEVKHAVEQ